MITLDYLCYPLFTRVYLCLLVYYPGLPLVNRACLPMFTHVYSCLPTFTRFHLSLALFTRA